MNIFEQYGIKEVADVTLYAIELDKYDDEVYIPIMYLDTLKVSTVEQSAEQTSARGGLGNPELIIWDYGKEITVTLEDALFTPASQSLMWGGKFGTKHSKIRGVWNPFVFPKDKYGRTKFVTQEIAISQHYNTELIDGVYYPQEYDFETGYPKNPSPSGQYFGNDYYCVIDNEKQKTFVSSVDMSDSNFQKPEGFINWSNPTEINKEEGWVPFICPCDNRLKYMRYVANIDGEYKYLKTGKTDHKIDQLDGSPLTCPKGLAIIENNEVLTGYYLDEITNRSAWGKTGRPEVAEIIIDNFGKFSLEYYQNAPTEIDGEQYCVSTIVSNSKGADKCGNALGYIWEDTDLKMSSLEGEQDLYYLENANIRFRTPIDSSNKQVMISQKKLYETEYKDFVWNFVENKEEVSTALNLARRYNTEELSYGWEKSDYSSKVDFYVNVPWALPNSGEKCTSRIKVGTFYIIEDWNETGDTPQDMIWPIEDGMEKVPFLDRMEKCKATQTFCINTDKNLLMGNYRYMPEYAQASLTVYIDPRTMKPYEPNSDSFTRRSGELVTGNLRIIKQHEIYYKWTRTRAPKYTTLGHQIVVDAKHFPGTYRLVGETYARNRNTGKDQRYQFEIPLAKMGVNNNLTLQADGDPTTFTMTLKALRREDGVMMKLTQYDVDCEKYEDTFSGSTRIVPISSEDSDVINYYDSAQKAAMEITNPVNGSYYGVNIKNNTRQIQPEVALTTTSLIRKTSYDEETLQLISDESYSTVETKVLDPETDYTIDIEEV